MWPAPARFHLRAGTATALCTRRHYITRCRVGLRCNHGKGTRRRQGPSQKKSIRGFLLSRFNVAKSKSSTAVNGANSTVPFVCTRGNPLWSTSRAFVRRWMGDNGANERHVAAGGGAQRWSRPSCLPWSPSSRWHATAPANTAEPCDRKHDVLWTASVLLTWAVRALR